MNNKLIKRTQDILAESYDVTPLEETNIVYEQGYPLNYKDEFQNLWLIHMEYLRSIQNNSTPEPTVSIFNESLNKFLIKHKQTRLFLAKENKKAIGFLQAGIATNKTYGFISDLHVLEDYRRLGIGEKLLKDSLEWFSENKIKDIGLEVTGGNEKVLEFYTRNGFNIDQYTLKMKKE